MNTQDFAKHVLKLHPGIDACYIAVMENDMQYDLEVETSREVIAGTYRTTETDLGKAQQLADELDLHLTKLGVQVFKTRTSWDDYLFTYYDHE